MPTIQKITSVAANSVSLNVLADELNRVVAPGRPIRVSCKSAATGIKTTILQQTPLVNDQDITFNATNQFPIIPDDVLTSFRSQGGELFVTHRNTTGAAIVVVTKVEIA
jgi:hypothetical protein